MNSPASNAVADAAKAVRGLSAAFKEMNAATGLGIVVPKMLPTGSLAAYHAEVRRQAEQERLLLNIQAVTGVDYDSIIAAIAQSGLSLDYTYQLIMAGNYTISKGKLMEFLAVAPLNATQLVELLAGVANTGNKLNEEQTRRWGIYTVLLKWRVPEKVAWFVAWRL